MEQEGITIGEACGVSGTRAFSGVLPLVVQSRGKKRLITFPVKLVSDQSETYCGYGTQQHTPPLCTIRGHMYRAHVYVYSAPDLPLWCWAMLYQVLVYLVLNGPKDLSRHMIVVEATDYRRKPTAPAAS